MANIPVNPMPHEKAGQQNRCVLPPHGSIAPQEKESAQQGADHFKDQAVGCGLSQAANHAIYQKHRQTQDIQR
jgi:hypothetical protein